MRTFTLLLLLLTTSFFTAIGQDLDLKGALSFGSEVEPGIGLHLGAQYPLNEQIDLAGGLTFYLPDTQTYPTFGGGTSETSVFIWMFDADGHYVFNIENDLNVYPLAGINITGVRYEINDSSDTNTELGLNIGGGADYAFAEQLKGFAELKYVISDIDQAVINLGVLYTLSGI